MRKSARQAKERAREEGNQPASNPPGASGSEAAPRGQSRGCFNQDFLF